MDHQTILAELTLTPGQFMAIGVFYLIAGVSCLGLGALNLKNKNTGSGVLSILVGLAGLGYGGYILLGDADTVWVSFKIFLLPVLVVIYGIVALVRGRAGRSSGGPTQAMPYQPGQPGAQPGQPGAQPGWGQPGQPGQYGPGQQPGGYPGPQPGQPAGYGQPAPGQPTTGQPGAGQPQYGAAQPGGVTQPGGAPQYGQAGVPPQPAQRRDPQGPPPPPPTQTDQPLWPGQNT